MRRDFGFCQLLCWINEKTFAVKSKFWTNISNIESLKYKLHSYYKIYYKVRYNEMK